MKYLGYLRTIFITVSKVLALVLCIYFITKTKEYEISWSLLTSYLFPSWVNAINTVLSKVGTYLLVIPLTIIIVSFLYESKVLNIMASLFSVGSCLIGIITGITRDSLQEYFNFRIVTVYHGLKLQDKMNIFMNEYRRITLEISDTSKEKFAYLQEHLSDFFMLDYIEKVKHLPAIEIKPYADNVVKGLLLEYDKPKPTQSKWDSFSTYIYDHATLSNAVTILIITGVVIGGIYLGKWIFSPDLDGAKAIATNGVTLAAETSHVTTDSLQIINENFIQLAKSITAGFKQIHDLLQDFTIRIVLLEKTDKLTAQENRLLQVTAMLEFADIKTLASSVEELAIMVKKLLPHAD